MLHMILYHIHIRVVNYNTVLLNLYVGRLTGPICTEIATIPMVYRSIEIRTSLNALGDGTPANRILV